MTARIELPPHQPRSEAAKLALDGIRVIDFTHFIAGPVCTLILADFGAEVIKIENAARGDDIRAMRTFQLAGEGGPFLWANRNKQSVGLDLSLPKRREVARRLITEADIVVENFSAGVMERLGLDYASVSAGNSRLIYCSISAFGREGELAQRAGFDPVAQAEGGLMSVNSHPGASPVVVGTPVVDLTIGMMASNAILAALAARSRHGIGQRVEIAMFDQAVTMLAYLATNALISGENPVRAGNVGSTVVPTGVFEAADGPMFICCANERTYQRLAIDVLGRPDLATHADYATMSARVQNREALVSLLKAILATDSRDAWLTKIRGWRAGRPGRDSFRSSCRRRHPQARPPQPESAPDRRHGAAYRAAIPPQRHTGSGSVGSADPRPAFHASAVRTVGIRPRQARRSGRDRRARRHTAFFRSDRQLNVQP
jgi:crotonobetainyl-CoA:carnitine CoA-transferase CaiB-like acyl-CoA transferase